MRSFIRLPFLLAAGLWLALGPVGCQTPPEEQSPIISWVMTLLSDNRGDRREKVLDKLGSPDADLRREGVRMLGKMEWGDWEIRAKILSIMASGDPDAVVRATAVQVLAENSRPERLEREMVSTSKEAVRVQEVLSLAAKDVSALVRMESVLALEERQSESSMLIFLERLGKDEDPAIRAEAARALAEYHDERAIRALLKALNDEEFEVSYRARASLQSLTGMDFGYDKDAWQEWVYSSGAALSDSTSDGE